MGTKIQIEVTKLYKILHDRNLSQKDLSDLIIEKSGGEKVSMYILNEIVNGKRLNFTIKTASLIANALNVKVDDIIE